MNCKLVRKYMYDYIEREIQNINIYEGIKEHLDSCIECTEIYEKKLRAKKMLMLQFSEKDIEFQSRKQEVMNTLDKKYYGSKFAKLKGYSLKNIKAAAALIAGIAIVAMMPRIAKEINIASFVENYKKQSVEQKEAFAIYLVNDTHVKDSDKSYMDALLVEEEPILTEEDIVYYDWNNQMIKLKEGVAASKLNFSVPLSGRKFILVSTGKRIYDGTLWNLLSSFNFPAGVSINFPPSKEDYITIDFRGTDDIRYNKELKIALEKENKIVIDIDKITADEKINNAYIAIDKEIKSLCVESLKIQYERKTENMENIYTKQFISRIGEDFYWDGVKPYEIKNISEVTYPNMDNKNILNVKVNIKDRLGEYYEEITFIIEEGRLLIDNIENDI